MNPLIAVMRARASGLLLVVSGDGLGAELATPLHPAMLDTLAASGVAGGARPPWPARPADRKGRARTVLAAMGARQSTNLPNDFVKNGSA
jgi:hypothetical protein